MQLVINLLKVLCTNSAWQRRKLGKILQDWRVIYMQVCSFLLLSFETSPVGFASLDTWSFLIVLIIYNYNSSKGFIIYRTLFIGKGLWDTYRFMFE